MKVKEANITFSSFTYIYEEKWADEYIVIK